MTGVMPNGAGYSAPGTADPDQQTPRDRHIQPMAERGRIGWQRATGYGQRNHAETTMGRYKHLIGPKLRARSRSNQLGEVALVVQVLNRMIREAKPVSVRRRTVRVRGCAVRTRLHAPTPPVVETLRHGAEPTRLDPRIHDPAYDVVLCKAAPSIFFHTAAAPVFVRQGVDAVVVTGCTTSGCVRASVVDAFSYGFRVIVPENCVGDVEDGPHLANLRDVGRRHADVVTLDACLAHIAGLPRRNA